MHLNVNERSSPIIPAHLSLTTILLLPFTIYFHNPVDMYRRCKLLSRVLLLEKSGIRITRRNDFSSLSFSNKDLDHDPHFPIVIQIPIRNYW